MSDAVPYPKAHPGCFECRGLGTALSSCIHRELLEARELLIVAKVFLHDAKPRTKISGRNAISWSKTIKDFYERTRWVKP